MSEWRTALTRPPSCGSGKNITRLRLSILFLIWPSNFLFPCCQFTNFDFFFTLTGRLAEYLEVETENYLKMDPDPFDDRNPSRNPNCNFGHLLKIIFKKEVFMSKVIVTCCVFLGRCDFVNDSFP